MSAFTVDYTVGEGMWGGCSLQDPSAKLEGPACRTLALDSRGVGQALGPMINESSIRTQFY